MIKFRTLLAGLLVAGVAEGVNPLERKHGAYGDAHCVQRQACRAGKVHIPGPLNVSLLIEYARVKGGARTDHRHALDASSGPGLDEL